MFLFILTTTAFVAAVLSGAVGIGGGTLLIGVMYALGLAPVVVVPLHAAVQLVSNASRTIAYLGDVNYRAAAIFMVGAIPAPFLVAPLIAKANPDVILLVMTAFILMAVFSGWKRYLRVEGPIGMVVAGALAGGVGMVVGATGVLIAPFFLRADWPRKTVIATLALCQSAAHVLKIVAFATYGFNAFQHLDWFAAMAVAVVVGTFTGKHAGGYISEARFRLLFRVVMLILASKLAFDGLTGLGLVSLAG